VEFIKDPFEHLRIPIGDWTEYVLQLLVTNFRWLFQALREPVDFVLGGLEGLLTQAPPLLLLVVFTLFAWQIAGVRVMAIALACFTTIGLIGAWEEAMTTLAIVLTSILYCSAVGIPLGVASARSNTFDKWLRPVLDLMQTIPSFVYLVPVVMLFGIGNVPGVIVTIVYALPPVVRLTNLGIRQVPKDLTEAALAFGASRGELLRKIEFPLAMPSIMAGVNQTIMMSLSMVVVASMISVTGLGQMVLRGIGRLDVGLATVGGLGIVLLAIAIDRVSQGFAQDARSRNHLKWHEAGPIGLVRKLVINKKHSE